MRNYFLIFFAVFLACTNAQYSYPEPEVSFPTPSNEYLPPETPTTTLAPPTRAATTTTTQAPTTRAATTTTTQAPTTRAATTTTTQAPTTRAATTTTTTEKPEPNYDPDSNNFDSSVLIPEPVVVETTTLKPTTKAPATTTEHEHHDHDEVLFWDFRESIPGEPGQDYPILDKIPTTEFKCNERLDGYYADLDAGCQVFHVCSKLPDETYIQSSFLCPNGTIFQQETFSCQWWADVECASSTNFYELNAKIGVVPEA